MKKWVAGWVGILFFLGMGIREMGVQAGNHFPAGEILAKKDKEKEEKGLKNKEEKLEAKERELNSREEALNKKEETLKKWEDKLKKQARRFRRGVQQGAGAGLQQTPGAPVGFSPRTTIPKSLPQPNIAVPKNPPPPAATTPPRQ